MRALRCQMGLHSGHMEPSRLIDEEIEALSAFVCQRCGAVIE